MTNNNKEAFNKITILQVIKRVFFTFYTFYYIFQIVFRTMLSLGWVPNSNPIIYSLFLN